MNDTYYRQIIERVNFLNPNNSQLINTALFLDKFGPIYQPHQYKNLGEFTTGKKDLKKGISRIPLDMARIKDADEGADTKKAN